MKEFVIVGGGTAGWLCALTLSKLAQDFQADLRMRIVVPTDEGTVGVGEASVDSFLPFIESLGLDARKLMKETGAFFKQSILFKDWNEVGKTYWHPFYEKSLPVDVLLNALEAPLDFNELFLNVHLARAFKSPYRSGHRAGTGIHFDNFRLAAFFKKEALKRGVICHDAKVVNFTKDPEGNIRSATLSDGEILQGDLFLDCSGFKSIILSQELKEPFISFTPYLLNDRALAFAVPYKEGERAEPWTTAQAMTAGWCWTIPLQERKGLGYVYSSQHLGREEAEKEVRAFYQSPDKLEARSITIRCGYHEKLFVRNVLAIGLSSGFIEPLESSGIWLITRALEALREFLVKKIDQAQLNKRMKDHYLATRDFLFVHYKFSRRRDSTYWRAVCDLEAPETLKTRLELLDQIGQTKDTSDLAEKLKSALWPWDPRAFLFILNGFDYFPKREGHAFSGVLEKFRRELEAEVPLYEDADSWVRNL